MSYAQFRSPPRPSASVLDLLPKAYVLSLRRTPKGLLSLARWNRFDEKSFREQFGGVVVKAEALADGAHGATRNTDTGIWTEISTYNQQPGDRMLGWTAEEILNVVGVHELCHIVFDQFYADTDGCVGTYCPCHGATIGQELVSRIQHSLIHPAKSAGKAGWLAAYLAYFGLARQLRGDETHKRLCREVEKAGDEATFAALATELGEYEQQARLSAAPSASDQEFAHAAVMKLYGEAVGGMKKGATLFAKEGEYESLQAYAAVDANAEAYGNDAKFELIP
jgi:hypothetical protein